MVDPEIIYTTALAELRAAEANYADAETRLIHAQRGVATARVGTAYHRALHRADQQITTEKS